MTPSIPSPSPSPSRSAEEVLPKTAMELLAIEERMDYETTPSKEREKYKHLGDFIHSKHPDRSTRAISIRSKLHYSGERARLFWLRIEAGMALTTANNLLFECEQTWRKRGGATTEEPTFDDLVKSRLEKYDSSGSVRSVRGKTFRTATPTGRAASIAKGAGDPVTNGKKTKVVAPTRHKSNVRDAIAGWAASRLPEGDSRIASWTDEFMREIEVILETFSLRFKQTIPKRHELFQACILLNIPRPRWGLRADQERAWKNRRSALKATHPDRAGSGEDARDAFQNINDSYALIVAYNDSLLALKDASSASSDNSKNPNISSKSPGA
jgi:hypothetical protein